MKVTHIITCLDVGGAELALKNIVEYSEKNNIFQNRVISLTSVGAIGKKLQALGIEVIALNMRGTFDVPRVIWQLTKLLKKQNPDIVQTWLYHADLLGGIASRFARIKKIFWGIRSTDILAGKGVARSTYFIMKICAQLSYFIPNNIVCVAQAAMKTHQQFGYCHKKFQVIYNGFNVDIYNDSIAIKKEIRSRFSIPDDAIVIGSVGRFNEYKDHKNFIDAAAIIAANNKNIIFLLIGRDIAPQNTLLMEWINNTGFKDNFILAGESNEVNLCYAAMDIFCLHSKSEAFPNVVVEAMLSAIPCVVTNVGDSSHIVGESGVIVPAQDSEKLAEGIRKIINLSVEERLEIGRESRNYAARNYSLEAAVRKYEALYKEG
jgi:glycosyltransferase involved in cell wall biosynthesis